MVRPHSDGNVQRRCHVHGSNGFFHPSLSRNFQTNLSPSQCFFEVGYGGILLVVGVFIADTASDRYRAMLMGWSKTPYIVKVFLGPVIAQKFQQSSSFRWAFGTFAIAYPVFCLPILVVLYLNQRKAANRGIVLAPKTKNRTLMQSFWYYFVDYDGENAILSFM